MTSKRVIDSGAKTLYNIQICNFMVFVVNVFNAMQQKARQGKSHVLSIEIISTRFVNQFCNPILQHAIMKVN
jgi:hypothetical protein